MRGQIFPVEDSVTVGGGQGACVSTRLFADIVRWGWLGPAERRFRAWYPERSWGGGGAGAVIHLPG